MSLDALYPMDCPKCGAHIETPNDAIRHALSSGLDGCFPAIREALGEPHIGNDDD